MSIEQWLDQYGYWAVFCGVFLEGPITLALAGFLAHQGYLNIFAVCATAFVATFMVVEIGYFIGLVAGQYLQARWPFWRRNNARFSALIERHKPLFIMGFRYFSGSHTVIPMAIGMGRIRPAYFSAMNAISAALWTLIYFLVGYFFGHAFELLIEDVKRHEKTIALVLVAVIIIIHLARRWIFRRGAARQP
ncbi:MAG: DedA family protein [Kiritimatiellaeota bacterium]|nr:DedA family protein [Kiritimatiellota bacterium]